MGVRSIWDTQSRAHIRGSGMHKGEFLFRRVIIFWRVYLIYLYINKMLDGIDTTLYPRYPVSHLPREGLQVCVVGQVVDVSETNVLTLECDTESKQQLKVEVPGTIEAERLKAVKFIEVRGTTSESGDILMREYTNMKDNFDLKTYNEIVGLVFKEFKSVFNYPESS